MEYAANTVLIEFLTPGSTDPSIIEISDNVCCYFTGSIAVENLTDDSCLVLVNIKLPILTMSLIPTRSGVLLHTRMLLLQSDW